MEFRPCIDIHDGKVKQIVGGSLNDLGATVNFETEMTGVHYAKLYESHHLKGGHIIMLNPITSEYYQADKKLALDALMSYPGGLQIGGGITADNASEFIDAGASHVIVTSYAFKNGKINYDNIERLADAVGREHIVLDLSCRRRGGCYYIVTDRWQNFTDVAVSSDTLTALSSYCDEFLIHAADVEGRCQGIEEDLVRVLDLWDRDFPITYAGGIGSYDDIYKIKNLSHNRINITIGSALDLFGGSLEFEKVIALCR